MSVCVQPSTKAALLLAAFWKDSDGCTPVQPTMGTYALAWVRILRCLLTYLVVHQHLAALRLYPLAVARARASRGAAVESGSLLCSLPIFADVSLSAPNQWTPQLSLCKMVFATSMCFRRGDRVHGYL